MQDLHAGAHCFVSSHFSKLYSIIVIESKLHFDCLFFIVIRSNIALEKEQRQIALDASKYTHILTLVCMYPGLDSHSPSIAQKLQLACRFLHYNNKGEYINCE